MSETQNSETEEMGDAGGQEFDSAYDELLESTESAAEDSAIPDTETRKEGDGTDKDKDKTGAVIDADDEKQKAGPEDEKTDWQAEAEKLKKQAEDNQSYATRLAQENATLRAEKDALKKQKPSKKESGDKKTKSDDVSVELPQEAKDYLNDYPDAKPAIEAIAKSIVQKTVGDFDPSKIDEIGQTINSLTFDLGQEKFNNAVLGGTYDPETGGFVEGHPDVFKVLRSAEFKEFKDSEAVKGRIMNSISNPIEAIRFIDRFKAEKAEKAASDHDAKLKINADQKARDASGVIDSGNRSGVPDGGKHKNEDFDSAFDEFAG